MRPFRIGSLEVHLPAALYAFALGAAGGFLARALGLPLPMLLGSLLAVGGASVGGLHIGGVPPRFPVQLRMAFIPVIGVSIGGALTADVFDDVLNWWPSLLALTLYIPLAHWTAYLLVRSTSGLDPQTAYWGSVPGGLIESVVLGDEAGADTQMVTMLQFLRLIFCLMIVPTGFTLATGNAVGSATGEVIGGAGTVLSSLDWVILAAAGAAGVAIGKLLRFPAFWMTGPILTSGLVHIAGIVEGGPPRWLIDLTQLVMGVSLGTRFIGMAPRLVLTALRLAGLNIALVLGIAAVASALLHGLVGERWEAVFLAFAPGGLAEMALVAVSLELSVIYVTIHHIARIVLSIAFAKALAGRITEGRRG